MSRGLLGTADGLIHVDRILHDRLAQTGKSVRMEIFQNGYQDFHIGPQGHAERRSRLPVHPRPGRGRPPPAVPRRWI